MGGETLIEQARYQVRFDWGVSGAAAIGTDADVVVWVDALSDASSLDLDGLEALPGLWLATADFRTAASTADWVADLQASLSRRLAIAIIAAGARRDDGSARFAVEDQLAAGAVIDALGARGIDATSPEAAATQAAFRGLSRSIGHLLTASVSATRAGEQAGGVVSPADGKGDPGAEPAIVRCAEG